VIQFELIFAWDLRFNSRFAFLTYRCPGVPALFVEKAILHQLALDVSQKSNKVFVCIYLWVLHSVALMCVSVPLPIPHSLAYYKAIVFINTSLLVRIILTIFGLESFYANFRIKLPMSTKIAHILKRITLTYRSIEGEYLH
jgi:hypothetical protein